MSSNPASLNNLSQMTGMSPAELARRAEGLVDAKTGKIAALSALDAALVANIAGSGRNAAESFTAQGAQSANPHSIDDPAHTYTHGAPQGGYAPEPPAAPSIGGPLAQLEKAAKSGAQRMAGFCGSYNPPREETPPAPLEGGGNAGGCDPGAPLAAQDTVTPGSQTQSPPPAASTPPARTSRVPVVSPAAQALQGRMRGFGGPTPTAPGGNLNASPLTQATQVQGELDATSRAIQFEKIKMEIQKMTELQNAISNVMATMHEQGMTAIRNAKA